MTAFRIPVHARNTVFHPNGLWAVVLDRSHDPDWPSEEQALWIWSLRRVNTGQGWEAESSRGASTGAVWPPANITAWLGEMLAMTNANFRVFTGNPEEPPTVSIPDGPWPATFEGFQAWFVANLGFLDTYIAHRSQLPAEQSPPPASDVIWAPRQFVNGWPYEFGIKPLPDGTAEIHVRANTGGGMKPAYFVSKNG